MWKYLQLHQHIYSWVFPCIFFRWMILFFYNLLSLVQMAMEGLSWTYYHRGARPICSATYEENCEASTFSSASSAVIIGPVYYDLVLYSQCCHIFLLVCMGKNDFKCIIATLGQKSRDASRSINKLWLFEHYVCKIEEKARSILFQYLTAPKNTHDVQ